MWKPILRATLPILLFLGAVSLLIYGARFHYVLVYHEYEEEQEFPIAPPAPFAPQVPGPEGGPPLFGQPPFEQPGEGPVFVDPFQGVPPSFLQTIKAKVTVTEKENQSEPRLIREVTFGGVTLSAGRLMRTYTGQPPSLCPT
jgi:hypothetical protein